MRLKNPTYLLIFLFTLHMQVTVSLPPSIERFEEFLCTTLNNERLEKDQLQPDGSIVKIFERKLKVGLFMVIPFFWVCIEIKDKQWVRDGC